MQTGPYQAMRLCMHEPFPAVCRMPRSSACQCFSPHMDALAPLCAQASPMCIKAPPQQGPAVASSGYLPPRRAFRRCMLLGKFSRVYIIVLIWVLMAITFSARSFSSIWSSCKMHATACAMVRGATHTSGVATFKPLGMSGHSSPNPLH